MVHILKHKNMIVNPDKFQAIIISRKHKDDSGPFCLKFNDYEIKSKNSVILLGIEIDNKLTFEKHTQDLIRNAGGQLNFMISKKRFLNQEAKRVLIESYFIANFNYCPLVWIFCNKKLTNKQELIQKRALRFLYDDYESDYEYLLKLANKPTIGVRKLRTLAIEIFKTLNDLNPPFMKEIFTLNTRRDNVRNRLVVKTQNSKRYGSNSLRSLGPKIWNKLPDTIRTSTHLYTFKQLIKTWSGPECACSSCSNI